MAPPLISLRDAEIGFGGPAIFSDLSINLSAGQRICLVGRNGCGKSTLLKALSGELPLDHGDYFIQPGKHAIYLPQDPRIPKDMILIDWIAEGLSEEERLLHAYRIDELAEQINLSPDLLHRSAAHLSGGEERRAAIIRAFLSEPDILLLDEPTNHLDLPSIQWLEKKLAQFRGALAFISHDRAFLRAVSNATLWLDRGQLFQMNDRFDKFEEWSDQILAEEEKRQSRLDVKIKQETHWLHRGVTARRKRNMGRLRALQDLRQTRRDWVQKTGQIAVSNSQEKQSGQLVIEAKNLNKSFDGRQIISDFSLRIQRKDRIGIIGPNGAGKSTLIRLLTGQDSPDSGDIKQGTQLTPVYFDQKRQGLDEDASPWEVLCGKDGDTVFVQGQPKHVVSYLRDFLFDERQAKAKIRTLSGGEKNRLILAQILAKESNLMILDEPTNDLDMDTLDLLQDTISDYQGTLILVSHDRDFLDRLVSSILAFDGKGHIREFIGGYQDMLAELARTDENSQAKVAASKTVSGKSPPSEKDSVKTVPKKAATKLSYKEQRLLDQLPDQIAELETEIATLEAALADPALYQRQPDQFKIKSDRLQLAQTELADSEEQWLILSEKEEMLKG